MGLSDNSDALIDAIAASSWSTLEAVRLIYGIKFGDGRYEKKSADGRGDTEKLLKDVRAAVRGKLGELLVARIEALDSSSSSLYSSPEQIDASWSWDRALPLLATLRQPLGVANAEEIAISLSGSDARLGRALLALLASPLEYWTSRLREAASSAALNKRLLLRIAALSEADTRATMASRVPQLAAKLAGVDEETLLFRFLFAL